jgi:predicted nucleotidyltransferase
VGMRIDELLSDVTRDLRATLGDGLLAVALFGSRARGDAKDDSDVDVYVLAEGLPADPFDRVALLARARPRQIDYALSLVARTPEEFEADITPLHLDLALDARVLYERAGWLSSRLAIVRQRIEEATLVRRADLVWQWRVTPRTCDWAITWEGVRT